MVGHSSTFFTWLANKSKAGEHFKHILTYYYAIKFRKVYSILIFQKFPIVCFDWVSKVYYLFPYGSGWNHKTHHLLRWQEGTDSRIDAAIISPHCGNIYS